MTTKEAKPSQEHASKHESEDRGADPAVGTEAELKGGTEPAKRDAERDWQNSSKESGE